MGLFTKTDYTPLISFEALIDYDMSIISYIILEFRNDELFNLNKVSDMTYLDIVKEIYTRKYENPLYFFLKADTQKPVFDNIYNDLIAEKEREILKHAVGTEIYTLAIKFFKDSEIHPCILYYTDAQKEYIENEKKLSKFPIVDARTIKLSKNPYYQFYFKYIREIEPFKDLDLVTFYISTLGINLTDNNEDINMDIDLIRKLYKQGCEITLYSMYDDRLIGGYEIHDSEE